jgi:hypothetical protein
VTDELFTAEEIDAASDIAYEDVPVPEWGGKSVRIRSLDGMGRAQINGTMFAVSGQTVKVKAEALAEAELRTLAACMVDANFNPLYSPKQIHRLGKKNAKVLARLYEKAQELSGMDEDAVEDAAEN